MPIKETYFAICNRLPKDVHREFVMRKFRHVLAPSWNLVKDWVSRRITWKEYEERYRREIDNPKAKKKIIEIINRAKKEDVYLICLENSKECHRFILMDIMEGLMR